MVNDKQKDHFLFINNLDCGVYVLLARGFVFYQIEVREMPISDVSVSKDLDSDRYSSDTVVLIKGIILVQNGFIGFHEAIFRVANVT